MRQLLLLTAALAVGLSIWRLPSGDWPDIPLATVSVLFIASLLLHCASIWHTLRESSGAATRQRWGVRILLVGLIGLAITLMAGLAFRSLTAAGMFAPNPEDFRGHELSFESMASALILLAMLAATNITRRPLRPRSTASERSRLYHATATVLVAVGVVAFAADMCLVPALVYIAVTGIEISQPISVARPDIDVVARQIIFARFSFLGGAIVLANVLAVLWLAAAWSRQQRGMLPLLILVIGLVAEWGITLWIVGPGVAKWSPEMAESLVPPALPQAVLAIWIVTICAFSVAWSRLATLSVDAGEISKYRPAWLHESWVGSLLMSLAVILWLGSYWIGLIFDPPMMLQRGWQYSLSYAASHLCYPPYPIFLAAAFAGLAQAWVRWHQRTNPCADSLLEVHPVQWSVIFASLMILTAGLGPIAIAVGVSFWFAGLPRLF